MWTEVVILKSEPTLWLTIGSFDDVKSTSVYVESYIMMNVNDELQMTWNYPNIFGGTEGNYENRQAI
jgi:hypothetical protein